MTMIEFKDVELVQRSTNNVGTFEFHTDMPGGVLALRKSAFLPVVTERSPIVIPLDGIEGTQYEAIVSPSAIAGSATRLYEGVLRWRKIGVYLTPGEVWKTQPISLGV